MIEVERTAFPAAERAQLEVRTLNEAYIAAVRACDAGWFRDHLSDAVVVIQGNGRRMTKPEFLQAMEGQPRRFRTLTLSNVTLRVFGAFVQVDADAPWQLESGESGVSRYIDTYAWADGKWQVISAQVTPLQTSP